MELSAGLALQIAALDAVLQPDLSLARFALGVDELVDKSRFVSPFMPAFPELAGTDREERRI